MNKINSQKVANDVKENNKGTYLEIYIEDNGRLILTPLTKNTMPIYNQISDNLKKTPDIYCG